MSITEFYTRDDLYERLTTGVGEQEKRIILVVGSAVSCAHNGDSFVGVPNVAQTIDLIKGRFEGGQARALETHLANGDNPYQSAFKFLLGRRGPEAANGLIKSAVAQARVPLQPISADTGFSFTSRMSDDVCRSFEQDTVGWKIPPATEAIARLATHASDKFGRLLITTNFDPLISVAIQAAGGHHFRSFYHRDGNISQASGPGSHIAHLHGYWYGSDTLHTPKQLQQVRPQLRSSLAQVFRENVVVFVGYGGWDDAITAALTDVINDDSAFPEIIWTFFDEKPDPRIDLINILQPGIDRGRVNIYAGIDCHKLLPEVADYFAPAVRSPVPDRKPGIHTTPTKRAAQPSPRKRRLLFEDDRPPLSEIFVGRDAEVLELEESLNKAVFITGIGGQGKSVLAAHYFLDEARLLEFDHRIWRDCRELGSPFQDQLLSIVEVLNDGRVTSAEIAQQPDDVLAELFCQLTEDLRLLIVFDNIDHFVDLEGLQLFGTAQTFVRTFISSASKARVLFTCRPDVSYPDEEVYSKRLQGLSVNATRKLFEERSASTSDSELLAAHAETKGHPFWLDLLAAQVAERVPRVTLAALLGGAHDEQGSIPDLTLRSIWSGLDTNQQIALQALAETVRPSTTLELADYVGSNLRLRQLEKSIASLKKLNLVVIKNEGEKEFFELHPVIRAFIRNTFKREQREPFIEAIIAVYDAIFVHLLGIDASSYDQESFQRWLENIELLLNAEKANEAVEKLSHVSNRFRTREAPNEFLRLCGRLFAENDFKLLSKAPTFETLFDTYVDLLTNLGRSQDAAEALEHYAETLEGKGARYIHYCDMQTYLHWRSEDYGVAIKWGQRGVELKKSTGVDTIYDSAHNLALAMRDSGAVEPALHHFLLGSRLSDILADDSVEDDREEQYYGNIGRCLHLMGQINNSLICYRKCAKVLEKAGKEGSVENEAFLRQWVGELLWSKGESADARSSLLAAWAKWKIVAPPKARRLEYNVKNILEFDLVFDVSEVEEAERAFLRWTRRV